MSTIQEEVQKAAPDPLVTLFELDATMLGGELYHFTSSVGPDGPIVFDGQDYTPVPVEIEGLEWNGKGPLPKPKLKLSNIDGLALSLIIAHSDLLGAVLTRIRTFKRFLDAPIGSDPDPTQILPMDRFTIDRKADQGPDFVEWELAASLDQAGKMLPARVAIRDNCDLEYRRWDPVDEEFEYSTRSTACPYAGSTYFKRTGQATTDPAEDVCGKLLVFCRLRFGTAPLPFGGFPSLAKTRAG